MGASRRDLSITGDDALVNDLDVFMDEVKAEEKQSAPVIAVKKDADTDESKGRKSYCIKLPKEVVIPLEQYHIDHDMTVTGIIRKALKEMFQREGVDYGK